MLSRSRWLLSIPAMLALVTTMPAQEPELDVDLPNEALKRPFAEQIPMVFVSRGQNKAEWEKLTKFFTEVKETALDPFTGKTVERTVVKIKLPLGLNTPPVVPGENQLTLSKWQLGKQLYFDSILSSDGTVSCSTCHTPKAGFSDASKTSKGINGSLGGMNAPTVINTAYNRLQFWDGRADSLEAQAQGPVQNNVEMFDGKGTPWNEAIKRVRKAPKYAGLFEKEFGHGATRDSAAKAIATYERTVLVGNSIQDRTDLAARLRAEEEETNKFEPQPKDYEKVLKAAVEAKDTHSLKALNLKDASDADKIPALAKSINNGRLLFFGKARCNSCHVGETFTDHTFHNLGVGVVDGKIKGGQEGRYGAQALGARDSALYGALKTPGLRGLLASAPYMHDGSEKTLEAVVDFYDKGGNANEFLDAKMRDFDAEKALYASKNGGPAYKGPEAKLFTRGGWPIIPKTLGLTADEKKDLVNYMRALEGEPIDMLLHKDN